MNDFIYVVPTHRFVQQEFLEGFFKEVDFANNVMHYNGPLVLFEDNFENINKPALEEYKKKYPNVEVLYITRSVVIEVYDKIKNYLKANMKNIFEKLYPNCNVNYGNVFNRIFIFAQILKTDKIIRRDSDCLIDNNGTMDVFPINIELQRLGKQIDGKTVMIVGGGYKGKYNLDIEDLILPNNDYTLVKELFTCMSIPEEHHDDIVNEEILGNNVPFVEDFIDNDSRAYPECGNVALYKLNEYFPAPTQDFILGSDYFFIDVAVHTKLNVTYHNRAVVHKHTSDRSATVKKIENYWFGFMELIDSQIFYRYFYDTVLEKYDFNNILYDQQVDIICNGMQEAYQHYTMEMMQIREQKQNELFKLLSKLTRKEIKECLSNLEIRKEEVYDINNREIQLHIDLIKYWKDFSNIINENIDNLYNLVLEKCKL